MAIIKYSEPWINGFAEEAAKLGLDQEGAKTLLKFAAAFENSADPKFQEGFKQGTAQFVKTAAPSGIMADIGSGIGKMFSKAVSTPLGALATGAAIPTAAAAGYYGAWRPYVNKGPFEREAQALRDAVEFGFLDDDQAAIAATQLRKRYADKHLAGTGYSSEGPGGYYNYGWNQSS